MRVAIVGSGIAGLSAAHHLQAHAQVSLFEAGDHFGGHANTVDITLPGAHGPCTHGVDTGFLVYNERTYPGLISLFEQLGIETAHSDMSFSVQAPWGDSGVLEWNGADLNTVFAQRRNLFRPRFWWLLRDILRFNRLATGLAKSYDDGALMQPLQSFLDQHGFGNTFRDAYLLPMLGCIWSCPTAQMLEFPAATMVRFCDNHGLLQVNDRPQWFTVKGGSQHYVKAVTSRVANKHLRTPVLSVERDADGVTLHTVSGSERFDQVVLACHADQALQTLAAPSADEQSVLSAIRFQDNLAVLHTDTSVMPDRKLAWAAWNYQRLSDTPERSGVCLHYWLNKLQPLPFSQDVFVSLNPLTDIDPSQVLGQFHYTHPVFDLAAIQAQRRMGPLQGQQHTWFAGAWMGYGFHEDGYKAGRAAAQGILQGIMQEEVV
ncbi:MAG: FAD-dependent oxidoreductase [Betaproteobacteria bacterium]|nr:FAD-dependent oxidoreductase [Betaproteobacteria bacterium]